MHGGSGGNGCMSFLRMFANEWAGPDGGDGGNGGHVIFQGEIFCNIFIVIMLRIEKSRDGESGGTG